MANMTTQEIIEQLDEMETRSQVVKFVQNEDISVALTENGLGVSYDSDAVDDNESEMDAFEYAEVWSFEKAGSFVRVYDIAKAQEILNVSEWAMQEGRTEKLVWTFKNYWWVCPDPNQLAQKQTATIQSADRWCGGD